ncbi:uncharacterized protein B0H18DRAFT_878572 [Fomitopsis serialis]|uniref:uncharacterized protein n=1 Tax=Fomitopsis serialis TaxID=139415 RepID=UPI0020079ABE|nr:uncharacterized protein B0H18DRAFT_878572 [Neoantrodia serialis]KAH9923529.1 hypothetical protein B0H18DRAFT_878572 [Neoantrodia serialis]
MSRTLPVELIRDIIFRYIDSCTPGRPSSLAREDTFLWYRANASKPEWHAVQPLVMVSKVLREVTLEAWFRTFVIRYRADLESLSTSVIPETTSWTRYRPRTIELAVPLRHPSQRGFALFTRLRKLRIDAYPNDTTYVLLELLGEMPPTILELEMRYHAWPNPQQLVPVARTFPNLQTFEMHQERSWCSLCNTCNVLRLRESPPLSITYTNGEGLPRLYRRLLAPLPHLHTVRLSVAYALTGDISLQSLKTRWRGECGDCSALFLADEEYVPEWEAKNKAEPNPPSLREVVWTFAYTPSEMDFDIESGSNSEADEESDYGYTDEDSD